jgi:hypothetical protein
VTTICRKKINSHFLWRVGLGKFFHNEGQPSNSEPGSRISVGHCQQVCHWVIVMFNLILVAANSLLQYITSHCICQRPIIMILTQFQSTKYQLGEWIFSFQTDSRPKYCQWTWWALKAGHIHSSQMDMSAEIIGLLSCASWSRYMLP